VTGFSLARTKGFNDDSYKLLELLVRCKRSAKYNICQLGSTRGALETAHSKTTIHLLEIISHNAIDTSSFLILLRFPDQAEAVEDARSRARIVSRVAEASPGGESAASSSC